MTNTQNPAPAATNPVGERRVQDASPAASVVKERGDTTSSDEFGCGRCLYCRDLGAYELCRGYLYAAESPPLNTKEEGR